MNAPPPQQPVTIAPSFWQEVAHTLDSGLLPKEMGLKNVPLQRPAIRSSSVECFQECPRKFMYRYRLGLEPLTYTAPLDIGTIYHRIMEGRYKGEDAAETDRAIALTYAARRQEVSSWVRGDGTLPGGDRLEIVLTKMEQDYRLARAMAEWAWEVAPLDTNRWQVLAVEQAVETTHPTLRRPMTTVLDTLLNKRGTKEVALCDHKTTGIDPWSEARTLMWSPQALLHRALAQAWLDQTYGSDEFHVVYFFHDIIKKPTIHYNPDTTDKIKTTYPAEVQKKLDAGGTLTPRQQVMRDEAHVQITADALFRGDTFAKYCGRVRQWYSERSRASLTERPYIASEVRFTGPLLPEELMVQLRETDAASRGNLNLAKFYRRRRSCSRWGKLCPYVELCERAPSSWPLYIEGPRAHYEVKTPENATTLENE